MKSKIPANIAFQKTLTMVSHKCTYFGYRYSTDTDATKIHILNDRFSCQPQGCIYRFNPLQHTNQDVVVDMLPRHLFTETGPSYGLLSSMIPTRAIIAGNSSHPWYKSVTNE